MDITFRKLAAATLALLMGVSLATPMASAETYEGEVAPIELTVKPVARSDGSYDVVYAASLTFDETAAAVSADLLAGKHKAEMDKLTFVCTLGDGVLNRQKLTSEELVGFTMTTSRNICNLIPPIEQGADGIKLTFCLDDATTSTWDCAEAKTIWSTLNGQTVAVRSGTLNVPASVLSGTITTTACVSVYKAGQPLEGFDRTMSGKIEWSKPSTTGGGSSGGSGGGSATTSQIPAVPEVPVITPRPEIVAERLVTDKAIAYTVGDHLGNWRPNATVNRSEVATMFYRLLRNKGAAASRVFSDTKDDAWYAEAVDALSGAGIIAGYADGTFHPGSAVTRAEFIAMCVRFASDNAVSSSIGEFPDIPSSHWARDAILRARGFGWIVGDAYGRFNPDATLTRTEAVTIINRMLGRAWDASAASESVDFLDVPKNFWGYGAIMASAA